MPREKKTESSGMSEEKKALLLAAMFSDEVGDADDVPEPGGTPVL